MSEQDSIFSDDWRESLRAHYRDVVRRDDKTTEKTLEGVLHDVGFRDEELRQLKLEATMRTEDLHDDFVPTLDMDDEPTSYSGVDVLEEDTGDGAADAEEMAAENVGEVQTAETEPTPDAPETVVPDMDVVNEDDMLDDAEGDEDDPGEQFQQMSMF